jgi:hypothetical protein
MKVVRSVDDCPPLASYLKADPALSAIQELSRRLKPRRRRLLAIKESDLASRYLRKRVRMDETSAMAAALWRALERIEIA